MSLEATVLSVNPTPIGVYKNKNSRRDKDLVVSTMAGLKPSFVGDGIKRYEDEGCFLSNTEKLSALEGWISSCAEDFAKNILQLKYEGNMFMTSSWLNEAEGHGAQACHMHANAVISGTYYVKRKKCHSPIVFFRHEQMSWPTQPSLHLQPGGEGAFTSHTAVEPGEGELLLWSSQVLHGYPPSGAGGRVSLSMNFMPEGLTHLYGFRISKKR